jgi:hypothetical protein
MPSFALSETPAGAVVGVARFGCALVTLWLATTSSLQGQLPAARIANLFPPGGRAGTAFDVTVAGSHLDEPARIHFSRSGITGTPVGDGGKFNVVIASNVPPGIYEARFIGRFGISNPRAFTVGTLAESTAPTTNTVPDKAAELKSESTINGRAAANAVAWFKFTAKKGRRLFAECLAETIDSRMDASLVVNDSAGRELERARTGGLIDFTAPADGTYLLQVSDFLYRGGDDYFYRLTLTAAPHVDFVFPPAGVAGTKASFTLYGRSLPGGKPAKGLAFDGKPLEQLNVEIAIPAGERTHRLTTGLLVRPGDASIDGFEYRLKSPRGSANPVLIGFATAPVVWEHEPSNNVPAQAQQLMPPCEVAGQFQPANEQDWFTFEAKKGDAFWIEVISQRLGLPTDPFLMIQRVTRNEKGEEKVADVQEVYDNDTNLGEREFNTASRDPVTRFEAKEDGTYRILVRDLFQRAERSPRFVYRLSVRRPEPDFRLVAQAIVPKYKSDAKNIDIGVPFLRRGETVPVRVMAFRRDGFSDEIRLSIENPPPGLVFEGDRIDAGKSSDFILITATDDAPAFDGPIKLIGRAKIGDRELVRTARAGTMIFPVGNTDSERPDSRLARELVVSISDKERAPVSIAAAEHKTWEARAGGKLSIPLRISRNAEFDASFKLKPIGPGASDALKEFEVDGKATNATLTLDLAALKLGPGSYSFTVQTQTTGKYRNNPEAAAFAEAAEKEAGKLAGELAAGAKKAAEALDMLGKAAKESEAAAKAAAENLAAAKAALEKAPTDQQLVAALDEAEKAFTGAGAKSKADAEARVVAETAKAAADEKSKEAKSRKEAAAARAKAATEKAKPKNATIAVHSPPIQVRVTAVEQAKSK